MLLLDTHAWIWTIQGEARRVGRRSRRTIAHAEARGALRLSVATLFEVVALHTAGRLGLAQPVEAWIGGLLDRPGLRLAEFTKQVAFDARLIPRTAVADPIDRHLVCATARQSGATLLTAQPGMLAYAAGKGNVRAQNPAK